jgi:2,4-dienoyl-CoA reductase-like NADH-dependent reductase (Old Yellow Enzyme family)
MGDSNPAATFGYVAEQLGSRGLAFLAARESVGPGRLGPELRRKFGGVYIANKGFSFETATRALAAGEADAVAFGKLFIANPDLPKRFARGATLNKPDPSTFYGPGARGYTDYPALDDNVATADEMRLAVA